MIPAAWHASLTLGVLGLLLVGLVGEVAAPDLVFLGCLAILLVTGVVTPEVGFSGFSNSALLTVGALFVVAAGIQRTGALSGAARLVAPARGAVRQALARMSGLVMGLSSVMNNAPLVALFIPVVARWEEEREIPASKLLLPLSYASIAGGVLTLMGCSTNVVVSGLLEASGHAPFGFFEITVVGLPIAVLTFVYLVLVAPRVMRDDRVASRAFRIGEQGYLFEVRVSPGSPVAGKTVEAAGLRALGQAFLAHLVRGEHQIGPVDPEEVLEEGDRLAFAGDPSVLERLLARPGFDRVIEVHGKSRSPRGAGLRLFEAVVSGSSGLVGRSLKEVDFRSRFQAVVLGARRGGGSFPGPLGTTPIHGGDLLLVEAKDGWDGTAGARDEFLLVVPRAGIVDEAPLRARVALGLLVAAALASASGILKLQVAAFAAALGMVLTGCLRGPEARRAINLPVLLVIAAAIGIGKAVEVSGLSVAIGASMVEACRSLGLAPALALIGVATSLVAAFLTNYAAVVITMPVALQVARDMGADPRAFALMVVVGAVVNFSTPVGYQTNLMVMGAGGYRFRDYLALGMPLQAMALGLATLILASR